MDTQSSACNTPDTDVPDAESLLSGEATVSAASLLGSLVKEAEAREESKSTGGASKSTGSSDGSFVRLKIEEAEDDEEPAFGKKTKGAAATTKLVSGGGDDASKPAFSFNPRGRRGAAAAKKDAPSAVQKKKAVEASNELDELD